ncbi:MULTISPECIES: TetR/AcrR family transcriptional regulator [Paraburkholderia]|uniref:AcrR family transcriptional regulator n=2 Tax=Paraburkholderia TaxID=1822464 RepID=A0A7Y9WT37_9BURK|nr:TetR/AcrR family transcriptional regulator [Paraburkholderia bryophila]NYH15157.1 AcrR family transcriptional regulator [Paraburkholderia bryophila]NYH26531.1 AcrR family transcriptional regulator [Paraburkholderia bryophila]
MHIGTKNEKRSRGRPRHYDPDQALNDARDAFWDGGYSGTSLDALSEATGMNRPSLYGAFGDKHALYLSTLDRYIELGLQGMEAALGGDRPLADALMSVYDGALAIYLPVGETPRGCFLIGTALAESRVDQDVRDKLAAGLNTFDASFERRLERAKAAGELDSAANPAVLAKVASAILHSLALRSRAGDSRASLRATAKAGIALICGTQSKPVTKASRHVKSLR